MLLVREFDPAGALAFSSAFLANFGANCPQLQPKLRATDESFDLPAFLKLASAKNHPPISLPRIQGRYRGFLSGRSSCAGRLGNGLIPC